MTRNQLNSTQYLNSHNLDWTSDFVDLVDALTEYYAEKYPHWTSERCWEAADSHAARSAE